MHCAFDQIHCTFAQMHRLIKCTLHPRKYGLHLYALVVEDVVGCTLLCLQKSFRKWVPHALQKGVVLILVPTKKWVVSSDTKIRLFKHTAHYLVISTQYMCPVVRVSHTHTILRPTSTIGALSSISI